MAFRAMYVGRQRGNYALMCVRITSKHSEFTTKVLCFVFCAVLGDTPNPRERIYVTLVYSAD